jgi:hypothetical protein
MRGRIAVLATVAIAMLGAPAAASAVPPGADEATATFDYTQNMHPLGFSARDVPLANAEPGAGVFNSDLAFWGPLAGQGTYAGFRLIDASAPAYPREIINYTGCTDPASTVGNQGDVLLWGNLLVRSWNSPVSAANAATGAAAASSWARASRD